MIAPPFLSLYDPAERTEGSIDPLGMMGTYERLAERIYPWITVRMARPRFLTAMVVGAHVCEGFAEDTAADNVTPAWLVFEWHVVEAFCRADLRRYPGRLKAEAALRRNQHLSAATYLKTPKVFGYTGIYRRLARGLQILDDDFYLDEGGYELLRAWEKDQRLDGFVDGRSGTGAKLLATLRKSVRRGMEKASVDQTNGWAIWAELTRLLQADRPGRRECEWISQRLSRTDLLSNREDGEAQEMRREILAHLERHGAVDRQAEPSFFRTLFSKVSPALRERLECINAYEGLGRTVDDAFRYVLHLSAVKQGQPVSEGEFASDSQAKALAGRLQGHVDALEAHFTELDWLQLVEGHVRRYRDVQRPEELYRCVLEHHEDAQRRKPPDGKRPWFERLPDGIVVRPMYQQQHHLPPAFDDTYVFDYRTGTASSFLRDLGRVT